METKERVMSERLPFLRRWFRTTQAMVLHLNIGILQVCVNKAIFFLLLLLFEIVITVVKRPFFGSDYQANALLLTH